MLTENTTISDLRRILQKHIDSLAVIDYSSGKGNPFVIYCKQTHLTVAKYACTSEEKEFRFMKGVVLFKGFELIPIRAKWKP